MAEEKLDDSKDMSFWEHLEALRQGLFHVIIALLAAFIVLFFFKDFLFDDLILAPTRSDFFFYKWFGMETGLQLVNIELSTQFMVHMRVTFLCAIIACCPYILFEIWRFIAPALYDQEKKAVRKAFRLSSGLFYLGAAVGYFIVLPVCLMFFLNYTVSDTIANTITLNSYIGLFVSMVFLIGLLFEFPTVILVLSSLGIVSRTDLRKARKWAFVIVLVLAALITPSDPVSMFVLALPLYALYEGSILICKS